MHVECVRGGQSSEAMKQIVFGTIRWAAAWAASGLFAGVWMMLSKVPPIAEPGAPSNVGFYAFWIPIGLVSGAVFGLLLGLIYGCVLAASELLLPIQGSSHEFPETYGRRLLCGAVAGAAIGLAALRGTEGLYVALAGVTSAAVSGYLNSRRARSSVTDAERKQ